MSAAVPSRWVLGPGLLGGEILVALAKARHHGTLTWQPEPASNASKMMFRSGRPAMFVDRDGNATSAQQLVVAALRQLAVAVQGETSFKPSPETAAKPPPLPVDTMGEVLVALVTSLPADAISLVVKERATKIIEITSYFEKLSQVCTQVGGSAVQRPVAGETLPQWLGRHPPTAHRAAVALLVLGGVGGAHAAIVLPSSVEDSPSAEPESESAKSTRAAPLASNMPLRKQRTSPLPAEQRARVKVVEIDKLYETLPSKNHYELLGIEPGASADDIRKKYFELAKLWHADSLKALSLADDVLTMSEEIFAQMSEAHRVLSDEQERQAYDFVLQRKQQGLPTDPAVIMEAEAQFQKAKVLMRRGQAPAAEPLLAKAVELNKGEPEFWAYWGYAQYCAHGSDKLDEALQKINKALESSTDMAAAYEFLGRIHRAENKDAEAMKYFKHALQLKPNNSDVEFELRLLSRRAAKAGSSDSGLGGLVGKLFKTKK